MGNNVTITSQGFLHITLIGVQIAEDVESASVEVDRLLSEHKPGTIRYLVDFTRCGRITPSARQAFRERLLRVQQLGEIKYAVIGVSTMLSTLLELFRKTSRTTAQLRFFKTEEMALQWLKE